MSVEDPKAKADRYGDSPAENMSLRDWLAGMAMNGVLASGEVRNESKESVAAIAFQHADAMLEEMVKQEASKFARENEPA